MTGKQLWEKAKERGWSKELLADKLGLSYWTVKQWIDRDKKLDVLTLLALQSLGFETHLAAARSRAVGE